MKNIQNITDDLLYIGASDRKLSLFEAVYPIVNGVSYNSYLLLDKKTVLFDTVDKHCEIQFFENLEAGLDGRNLDYFVINHLEPDHSALIKKVVEKYCNVKLVCNAKTKQMIHQFFEFDFDIEANFEIVKEGDILKVGRHELTFIMAPMVHWPEVMVTYDKTDNILFSADAFGSFGAINGNIFDNDVELDISEYRRYYTNIVGKYGVQVNMLLTKASALNIKMICPLHGVVLRENISKLIKLYFKWANYEPEINSALIVYASVYGGTQNSAEILASKLAQKGVNNIKMYDVSMVHHSFILADAFKYSHIIVATPTYNNGIFVKMEQFIQDIVSHNLQKRTYGIIQNGSWAPNVVNIIQGYLDQLKGSRFIEDKITLKSTLKTAQEDEIEKFANRIFEDINANENATV